MVMYGHHIWRWFVNAGELCNDRVWIASAFISSKRLTHLSKHLPNKNLDKILFTRWKLTDLVSGASDIDAYKVAKAYGWRFFVNLDLHAKTFLFDNSCLIGSANLTENGMLGRTPPGNLEMLAASTDVNSVVEWFYELQNSSCEINDELFERIERQYHDHALEKDHLSNLREYDLSLLQDLLPNRDMTIFTYDMFWSHFTSNNPEELFTDQFSRDISHDLALLRVENIRDLNLISERFIDSKSFRWLTIAVDEEVFFGELSSKLHSALMDDPAPFRKDVKSLLSNLLSWVEMFGKDYFEIDRPNVSQRIRRKPLYS